MLMVPATHGLLSVVGIAPTFTVFPSITGNSGGPGFASSSDTLGISYAVSGTPFPTITYLWQAGASVVGAASTLSLLSLAFNTITCTVTATNSAGTVSITTTSVFVQQSGG